MATGGALQLQDVLDGFRVGRELGTGARSVVYEVTRRSDGGLFACKFIPVRDDEDLRVIGHLENEFTVLTAIHEAVTSGVVVSVRAVDFQKLKKMFKVRAAYLVMERLVGEPLWDKRDSGLDDMLTIFRQVCLGLEGAHKAGYVHADLKPHNILVGEFLDVKLIDFGFAAPVGTQLTSAKGTFGYIAPEQAGGRLTEKTDVYNLGAVLYWAFTGQNLPSLAPGQHEASGFVAGEQINFTPPAQLNADVPVELSDTVLKCCALDPHDRPTVTELKRYLHGLQLRIDYGTL